MLNAIQALSIEAARALSDPEMPRDTLLNGLSVSNILLSRSRIGKRHAHD